MDGSSHRTPPCTARLSSRFSCRSLVCVIQRSILHISSAIAVRGAFWRPPAPGTDPARGDPVPPLRRRLRFGDGTCRNG